jgi:glycosyltransferase involved in cell wall biosynthesis
LKLVTVTHYFPAHGGGVERVADKLVDQFAARGITVQWFSSNLDPPPQPATNRVAIALPATQIVERLTQLPYPLWSPVAIPTLWRAIGAADVVHIHEHLYPGSMLAIVIARLRRKPVVLTQHTGSQGLGNPALNALYECAVKLLGWLLFPGVARPVFVSSNVQKFFSRQSDTRSRLIFNGVDMRRFTAAPQGRSVQLRSSLGLPSDRRIVLYVGRFTRKKGLRIVKTLAQRLPDVLWLCIGSGPENPGAWGCANVIAPGTMDQERLTAFYQAADLLLLPSFSEGFPLVVQEALACGLGVLSTEQVANACPPARDLIRAQPTPVSDADVAGWEAGVRATLQDETYLNARLQRSAAAHDLWSWERCVRQYTQLFEEVTK